VGYRERPGNKRVQVLQFGLWFCLALVGSEKPVFSQVNVEPFREHTLKKEEQLGWAGAVDGSIAGQTGNTNGMIFSTSSYLRYRHHRHLGFLYGKAQYSEFTSNVNVSRSFAHARYNLPWSHRRWWEWYGQFQHDCIRRLEWRVLGGTGPRVAVMDLDEIELFFGTSVMVEYERLNAEF
jgi:hypothetical protein